MANSRFVRDLNPALVVDSPSGSYPIVIRPGCLSDIAGAMSCREIDGENFVEKDTSSVILASDTNVFSLYGESLQEQLVAAGFDVHTLIAEPGEKSKSVSVASDWWSKLCEKKIDRKAVMIALGGGVVGDLAGFVASTVLRGIDVIQVPTTLLAQVDSSVGGKVGINLPEGKNLVGQFWHPKQVWIDSDVLQTLDSENFHAGMGEVVKYAMIADPEFFQWLSDNAESIANRNTEAISHIIKVCCSIKADVVAKDPTETLGLRAILNFGHTVGHAIENLSGYGKVLHGLAVCMGMVAETRLAVELGRCQSQILDNLVLLMGKIGLPTEMPFFDFQQFVESMGRDKKNEGKKITFMLPDRIGNVEKVVDPDLNLLKKVILK